MAEDAKVRKDKGGWFVYVRYQGERHFISHYLGRISFRKNKDLARSTAAVINSEIDKGIFRPERHKRRAKKLFNISGYFTQWIEQIESSLSIATAHDYRNSFKNHIIPILGDEYIDELNHDKLTYLLNHIQRQPKGKKNVMDALKRMLRYALQSGHINQLPIFPEMRGKNQVVIKEIRWVTPNEQIKILEHIRLCHRPAFTFIMLTGCRPSEARALKVVDLQKDVVLFRHTFGRREELKEVKGKKTAPFPRTEALNELLDLRPKTLSPYVFPNPETGRPYTKNINRIFNRAAKKAGFSGLSLNEFGRKSFAMNMLQHLDKGMVSHLLRHSDPRMIDHYGEYQTAPLKSALDKVQRICSLIDRKSGVTS